MVEHWLIITRRRSRRWDWELRNVAAAAVWASGTEKSFEAARDAGQVRAKIGPTGYLPERPNPGIPELWPKITYLPIRTAPVRLHITVPRSGVHPR